MYLSVKAKFIIRIFRIINEFLLFRGFRVVVAGGYQVGMMVVVGGLMLERRSYGKKG